MSYILLHKWTMYFLKLLQLTSLEMVEFSRCAIAKMNEASKIWKFYPETLKNYSELKLSTQLKDLYKRLKYARTINVILHKIQRA